MGLRLRGLNPRRPKAVALTEDPLEVDPETIWRLAEVSHVERRNIGICVFPTGLHGCCRALELKVCLWC